jgi:ribosomal protein S12 methylthiotransferase RimO
MRTVALVTLGCSRNEVDSEELAGRLAADGWTLVDDASQAEVALINTCGFIESAKKDSVDALIEAHSLKGNGITKAVVAVGCMAERYGNELAEALPEADAILGFDDYADISQRLQTIMAGGSIEAHTPKDRRSLLPLAPSERQASKPAPITDAAGNLGQGQRVVRKRLNSDPIAPLKIASGCDRRCSFCAIPSFRGSFISRRPTEILDEAKWLVDSGVTELFLVSENTTSYGKDLGDLKVLEKLLPELAAIDGVERIRLSYLQPAEMRPTLLQAMIATEKVVPYFDLSFQHASETLLRRMRRFGDGEKFLHLITQIRALSPEAGIRSNVIVGFPGETEQEFQDLVDFLSEARMDAVGVFGYSDEDKTEALNHADKVDQDVINARVEQLSTLVDELLTQRAEERIGERVRVLVEDADLQEGRAEHQGPEVDGSTTLQSQRKYNVGDYVDAIVSEAAGADLIAIPL